MSSSSMMSDGLSGVCASGYFNGYGYGFVCGCKLPVKVDTSNTIKNPNRRYLCCPKSMVSQCKLFLWLDPDPKAKFAQEWWNMKMWFGECAKLRAGNEACMKTIRDLEVKQNEMKTVKKKMKKELLFPRILCCVLFTVLLFVHSFAFKQTRLICIRNAGIVLVVVVVFSIIISNARIVVVT